MGVEIWGAVTAGIPATASSATTFDSIYGIPPSAPLPQMQLPEREYFISKGGEGEDGSQKNSVPQACMVNNSLLPDLNEALERVSLPKTHKEGPLVVADLGCSSGATSIGNLALLVAKVRTRFFSDAAAPAPPEFQAYFNDLPSNDFNNLFQLASNYPTTDFFVSGVPGPFCERLFPRASVHIFFSSHSLHWLSQIPAAVVDKDSPAYNGGRLWINDSRAAVVAAYKDQASSELTEFLNARAAELVPGGLLFFVFAGRSTSRSRPNNVLDDFLAGSLCRYLDEIWSELVSEGLLTEEQRDTINVPYYNRTIEEVNEAVESCRSSFHVQTTKFHRLASNFVELFPTAGPSEMPTKIAGLFKGILEALLEPHIGKELSEIFWQRYDRLIENKLATGILGPNQQARKLNSWLCVVSLIRK